MSDYTVVENVVRRSTIVLSIAPVRALPPDTTLVVAPRAPTRRYAVDTDPTRSRPGTRDQRVTPLVHQKLVLPTASSPRTVLSRRYHQARRRANRIRRHECPQSLSPRLRYSGGSYQPARRGRRGNRPLRPRPSPPEVLGTPERPWQRGCPTRRSHYCAQSNSDLLPRRGRAVPQRDLFRRRDDPVHPLSTERVLSTLSPARYQARV